MRGIAVYMWVTVALNAAAWLARIVPAWIAVELLILRRYFFLQPTIAGVGAAEILLAWRWQRSGKIVTGTRDQRP